MDAKTIQENANYFRYLYQLQRSGKTNMFGASPYLVSNFDLDKNEARAVLSYWMTNYESIAQELGVEI
jgi:hypothetical protein